LYQVTLDNIEVTDGKLRIGVKKTTTDALESWSCFDNFQLIYQGRNDWSLGDVNMDGLVNINDVVSLVNYILGQTPHPFNLQAADTSGDNTINISDVVSLVNIILQ
ncbi:MAG: dockerin type I repeat-containing protein, partial [Bacteroidaceae bacterium]|nr:dockerin type I repeat-containing protein [Bacteroidaceae bacterium]